MCLSYVETDSETSYCELNTVILNSSNSSSSPLIDGCVVYKASGDNFTANHSKIITQTSDNISASSYPIASSSSSSSSSSAVTQATHHNNNNNSSDNSNNQNSNIARLYTTTAITTDSSNMVLQQHLHHTIQPLIDSDHYHDQNSPVSSSDTALLQIGLHTYTMYSPYPTVTSSSSSPPLPSSNRYHQIISHRPSGAPTIDEVIADTLKDEHCTMIDGINSSPSGVLVANVTYNGNHSTANSDDGDNNSRSPNNVAHLAHADDYDGTSLQSFTHLTNADINHSVLSRDSVYSGTALFAPNNGTTIATPSIIHPIQTYESVLHPATPGRYVSWIISHSFYHFKYKNRHDLVTESELLCKVLIIKWTPKNSEIVENLKFQKCKIWSHKFNRPLLSKINICLFSTSIAEIREIINSKQFSLLWNESNECDFVCI